MRTVQQIQRERRSVEMRLEVALVTQDSTTAHAMRAWLRKLDAELRRARAGNEREC